MKCFIITRLQLYEEQWSKPGEEYGMTRQVVADREEAKECGSSMMVAVVLRMAWAGTAL